MAAFVNAKDPLIPLLGSDTTYSDEVTANHSEKRRQGIQGCRALPRAIKRDEVA